MARIKPQKCPECGGKYIHFDLHWPNCPKNPEASKATEERSYSDFAHNATDEEKKQVITKAINEANEEQRKEVNRDKM